MRAPLRSKGRLLTAVLKEIRRTRAKRLLQRQAYKGQENILFTGEKIFTIEEQYNNKYNKIYAQKFLEVRSEGAGGLHPSYVMVWWGGVPSEVTPLHFCDKGVKTGARVYQEDVLQGVATPLNTTFQWSDMGLPAERSSCPRRQEDSGVATRDVPAFISAEDWPSGSPDLNPVDYKLWAVLEDLACQKRHNNLDSLKRSLVKAAAEIPLETVRTAIAEWPKHLKACVGAEDGHFE